MNRCARLVFALALCLISWGCGEARPEPPQAVDGVMDLSAWDFERDGNVPLRGEWRFVWGDFVDPAPVDVLRDRHRDTMGLPGTWKSQVRSDGSGEPFPTMGFATYFLEVILPPGMNTDLFAAETSVATSAGRWSVYSATGESRLGYVNQGYPGQTPDTNVPVYVDGFTDFGPDDGGRVLILVHASNFEHARGGVDRSPRLGSKQAIGRAVVSKQMLKASVLGILLIIAVYHMVIYAQRREDLPSLYFALFCGAMAVRHGLTSFLLQGLGVGCAAGDYSIMVRLEYLAAPMGVLALGAFFTALFPGAFVRRFTQIWCAGGAGLVALIILFTSLETFTGLLTLYHVHIFGALVAFVAWVGLLAYRGNPLAKPVIAAMLILAVGNINDILHNKWIIRTAYISPYTFIAFILAQSGIISGKFAWAFERLRNLSEELSTALERARSADRLKGEILANLSHELRTPLNALINVPKALSANLSVAINWHCDACDETFEDDGEEQLRLTVVCPECGGALSFFSRLESSIDPEELLDLLERTADSGDLLNKTLSDMLEFAKLQSGTAALKRRPVQPKELIERALQELRSAVDRRGVAIEVNTPEKSRPLNLDTKQAEMLLVKVIENAIEYSPPDRPVSIWTTELADGGGLRISVRDEGPGIASEHFETIFESFRQIDGGHTRAHPGVGLGLSIAELVATSHGTRVQVESTPGAGSTFSVEFVYAGPDSGDESS